MKYSKWLDKWYLTYVKPSLKKKTCERYFEIIEKHLKVRLGDFELEEITPREMRRYVSYLARFGNLKTGKGLSANSVNGIITVLKSSLKCAYECGETGDCAADGIMRPKSEGRKVTCFTEKEQELLENAVLRGVKRSHVGVVICLYTGLRIGELLALTWADVDFENEMIYVNKTCHYAKNDDGVYGRITDVPKTVSSKRDIPLPKKLLTILRNCKRGGKSEYVIESPSGVPIALRSYQRSFARLQDKLKIKRRGFHSLRHTFATRALECGMDVKTLSEILGHNDATITLNRYAHSLLKHKREMMDKLGKRLQ